MLVQKRKEKKGERPFAFFTSMAGLCLFLESELFLRWSLNDI